MLSSTFSPSCTRIFPYGVVSLSRSKEAKNQNLNEFDQHWVIWNDHCAFVTAVYHVFERPCVFVLISMKIRILYVFKQSTQANSEQDKNAVFCIETVLVLTSIYVMWNAITHILLGIFHFDWVVVQIQMWKGENTSSC